MRVSAITADYLAEQNPRWKDMDVEEFGAAFVRFEDSRVMLFKISWAVHQNSLGGTFFLGKQAGISLGGPIVHIDEMTDQIQKLADSEGIATEVKNAGQSWQQEEMVDVHFSGLPSIDVWEAQMTAFGKAVRINGGSPIPPEGVLTTNMIMDGIFRSQQLGQEVAVDIPEI